MSALLVEVEVALFILVEVYTPADELFDLCGSALDDLLYGCGVADVVARYHGVFDVLVEIVNGKVRALPCR